MPFTRPVRAILAGPVSTGLLTSVGSQCLPDRSTTASPAFPPRALPRLLGTMRRSDSPPPFGSLASSACRPYSLRRAVGVSRVATSQDCAACQGLRPRGARAPSPWRTPEYCLLPDRRHRPSRQLAFRGSIPSTFRLSARCLACLRLSPRVTPRDSKAGYWWLASPFQGGFAPPLRRDLARSLRSLREKNEKQFSSPNHI